MKKLYIFIVFLLFLSFSCNLIQKIDNDPLVSYKFNGIYLITENGMAYPFFSDSTEIYLIDTIPIIKLSDIEKARKQKNRYSKEPELYLELNNNSRHEFAIFTKNHILDTLAIILNNKLILAPKIISEIPKGKISVNGIDENIIDDFVETFNIYNNK